MDLKEYDMEDLLLTAMKAEVDARGVYRTLAGRVHNAMLKDRLEFLAGEEEKHRVYFEAQFQKDFPAKKICLPAKGVVPLPEVKVESEDTPLSKVLEQAMEAELAAYDFYRGIAGLYADEATRNMIFYVASMEMGHYRLLAIERENAERFEVFEVSWPDVHVGP
ncbi:MAG: Rubrerythrin [candidate division Zixibacteria bacterium]|nr:Rubrerythrin [candidate division Zixibacteria bacterium]